MKLFFRSELSMIYRNSSSYDVLKINVNEIYSNIYGNFNLFDAQGLNLIKLTGVDKSNFSLLNPKLFCWMLKQQQTELHMLL